MSMKRRPWLGTAGVLTVATLSVFQPGPLAAQSYRTVTLSRQQSAEAQLEVDVIYGAGRFSIGPAARGVLYHAELRYDEEAFEPIHDFENGTLEIGVDRISGRVRLGDEDGGELNLQLSTRVPMELQLEFGAVRADLDLGGLPLTDLSVRTGASHSRMAVSSPNTSEMERATLEVGAAEFTATQLGNLNAAEIDVNAGVGRLTLDFTGDWQRDAEVSVDMGLGTLELQVPEGLGVKIEKSTFLASFDSEGLVKKGDAYYSLDWDRAERRVTMDVDAVFGSVAVVWVR